MSARFVAILVTFFVLIGISYQQITAQNLVSCPDLVQKAINAVGNNCGSLDRNSACYGFNNVTASFSQPQPVGFFTHPSDRARLIDLEALNTAAMNQALNQWGVALLNVQANLPETLPGQGVVFMLVGDTQVENAVKPDQAFQTGATVNVTMQLAADLYYNPEFSAQVVTTVPMGTALTADAISADGQWVRVVYGGKPGWATRQVITTSGDLTTLPVIGADTHTPMQAFYFRTSISGTACTEAPNALVVQGPKNLTVDINTNGANIRLGSTIALYLLPGDATMQQYVTQLYGNIGTVNQYMQIVVLDGHVVLEPGTSQQQELDTGDTSFICLSDPSNLGDDGQPNDRTIFTACPWAPKRPVTADDILKFRDFQGLRLNYPVNLPLELPTVTPSPTFTPTSTRRPVIVVRRPTPTFTPTFTPVPQQQQNQPPPPPPPEQPTATLTPTNTPVVCAPTTFDIADGDTAGLIAAIDTANADPCNPVAHTINLASGGANYTFDVSNNGGDGPNALPIITDDITINGNGAFLTNGGTAGRFFEITGSLTLNDLHLDKGSVSGFNGGAILNSGSLALNNVVVTGNSASLGGNIYNSGTVTVTNTSIVNGTAAAHGGGLYNTGTANINKSTIAYNYAGGGAGIFNEFSGTVNLLNSSVSENHIGAGAGTPAAIYSEGVVIMNFTTVAFNVGDGGAAVQAAGGTFISKNSIISNNAPNCSGTISVYGVNFDDDGTCSGFTFVTGDANLYISPLGSNGGPTDTNAIDARSAAVDTAECITNVGASVTEDQRGSPRPVNGNGVPDPNECDAGSYENQGG